MHRGGHRTPRGLPWAWWCGNSAPAMACSLIHSCSPQNTTRAVLLSRPKSVLKVRKAMHDFPGPQEAFYLFWKADTSHIQFLAKPRNGYFYPFRGNRRTFGPQGGCVQNTFQTQLEQSSYHVWKGKVGGTPSHYATVSGNKNLGQPLQIAGYVCSCSNKASFAPYFFACGPLILLVLGI